MLLKISDDLIDFDLSEKLGIYKYENCVGATLSSDAKGNFPSCISKTDEERIQNIFNKVKERCAGYSFTLTEKIDGTSCTVVRKDEDFDVCSRNLALKEPEGEARGVYWQEAIRLDLKNRLPNNYAIQGEIAGLGVQSNRQGLTTRDFFLFHVLDLSTGLYLPYNDMKLFCNDLNLNIVPIINDNWIFRDEYVLDDILVLADGVSLLNPKALREGIVWRLNDVNQKFSFKAISNEYILKWGL